MSLSSVPNARDQAGAQTSHPYENVGLTTASNRPLIMGNDLLHMSALCLALKRTAARLPFCASFAEAGKMLPDSWKTRSRYLEGGRMGQHMLPNMPCARSRAIEDHNLRLGGADGEAKGLAEAVHAMQK